MISHIANAGKEHYERIIVFSNDTDVAIYNLAYFEQFRNEEIKEISVRFGIPERTRNIPIHCIAEFYLKQFGEEPITDIAFQQAEKYLVKING